MEIGEEIEEIEFEPIVVPAPAPVPDKELQPA